MPQAAGDATWALRLAVLSRFKEMPNLTADDYIEFMRAILEAEADAVADERLTLADVRDRSGLKHELAVECLERLASDFKFLKRNPEDATEFLIVEPERFENYIARIERRGLPPDQSQPFSTPMDARQVCEILLRALIDEHRLYRREQLWNDYEETYALTPELVHESVINDWLQAEFFMVHPKGLAMAPERYAQTVIEWVDGPLERFADAHRTHGDRAWTIEELAAWCGVPEFQMTVAVLYRVQYLKGCNGLLNVDRSTGFPGGTSFTFDIRTKLESLADRVRSFAQALAARMASSPPPTNSPEPTPRTEGPVDLAIVIPLEEEFDQFLDLLDATPVPVRDTQMGGYDYAFRFQRGSAPGYNCVARLIGDMGPDDAHAFTSNLLQAWSPSAAIMVGIAGGLHSDIKLGDVVVAKQIDAYAENLKAKHDDGTFRLEHRGRVYEGTWEFLEEVKHLKYAHGDQHTAWQDTAAGELETLIPVPSARELLEAQLLNVGPNLHRVHLASGPVVGATRAYTDWLRQRDATLKALEMEAAGFMSAAHKRLKKVPTLVIRGISDFGDERKKELDKIGKGGIRAYAMRNAVRLLWVLLDLGVFPRNDVI